MPTDDRIDTTVHLNKTLPAADSPCAGILQSITVSVTGGNFDSVEERANEYVAETLGYDSVEAMKEARTQERGVKPQSEVPWDDLSDLTETVSSMSGVRWANLKDGREQFATVVSVKIEDGRYADVKRNIKTYSDVLRVSNAAPGVVRVTIPEAHTS